MEKAELYQLRAEEFERNFMSIREIEWRNAIEVFTGYAALAISYFQIRSTNQSSVWLGVSAILLDSILFSISLYLSLRVQERLHFTRGMQREYLKKLHEVVNTPELEVPEGISQPKHAKWYAFAAQLGLSATAAVSLLIYFLVTTPKIQ